MATSVKNIDPECNSYSINISSSNNFSKEIAQSNNISQNPKDKISLGDYSFTFSYDPDTETCSFTSPNATLQARTTSEISSPKKALSLNLSNAKQSFSISSEKAANVDSNNDKVGEDLLPRYKRFSIDRLFKKAELYLESVFGFKEDIQSSTYHSNGIITKPSLTEVMFKMNKSDKEFGNLFDITKTAFKFLKNSYVQDSRTLGWFAISTTSSTLLTLTAMIPYILLSKVDLNNSNSLSKISDFLENNLVATASCYILFLGVHYGGLYMMEMGREGLDNLQRKGGILKEFIRRPIASCKEVLQSTNKNSKELKERSKKTLYASIIDMGFHLPSDLLSNVYAFGSSLGYATPIYSGLLYLGMSMPFSTILAVSSGFLISQLTADAGVAFLVPVFWNGAKTAANFYYEKKIKSKM